MPGADSQSVQQTGIPKASSTEQLTPKSSHIAIGPQLFKIIQELTAATRLNRTRFEKELTDQMLKCQMKMREYDVRRALDNLEQCWAEVEEGLEIRDVCGMMMLVSSYYIPFLSSDAKAYEAVRNALTYSPTEADITKYNSLKFKGTRVPSVFVKESPANTANVSPVALLEKNANLNRLLSLCGKDLSLQILAYSYVTNPDRRTNIMFYICNHINKPSLITALSYLIPLIDIEQILQPEH